MPVELPPPIDDDSKPSPPNPVVWGILVILIVAGGVAFALVTWPKGTPTNTAWFWVRVLLLPSVAGGIVYGFRLLYWEQETDRIEAERAIRNADRDEALQFARDALAVIDHCHLCAIGDASAVVNRERVLEARKPANGQPAIRHTSLVEIQGSRADRYRQCFAQLLTKLEKALASLPANAPFGVLLQIPAEPDRGEVEETWRQCWNSAGYQAGRCQILGVERGMMDLDAWLDVSGGSSLERFALVVAVQLRDAPIESSAEAAVAILLGWAPLAERSGVASRASLHRPVEITADFNQAISKALLWGDVEAAELADVWQAGISGADRSALLQAVADDCADEGP